MINFLKNLWKELTYNEVPPNFEVQAGVDLPVIIITGGDPMSTIVIKELPEYQKVTESQIIDNL
jgi:hypothetical protein